MHFIIKRSWSWSGEINKFIAITAHKDKAEKYNINNIIEFDQRNWRKIFNLVSNFCIAIIGKKKSFDDFMAGGFEADIDSMMKHI